MCSNAGFTHLTSLLLGPHPAPQPKPAELDNPVPQATRQYVRMALHTAVHNTRCPACLAACPALRLPVLSCAVLIVSM
jgi:hypothetical protein